MICGCVRRRHGTRRTGNPKLLEATGRRKGTLDGAGGTLATPASAVRRTTPRHGKLWGTNSCMLRWPSSGSCRNFEAAGKDASVSRTRNTTRRCMTSTKERCKPSTLRSSVLSSNKQAQSWRSRFLRRTNSSPMRVRPHGRCPPPALGEATRGHSAAAAFIHAAAQYTAETEVLGLNLALTSGPPTSSPPPLATRRPPWTSRSALRTHSKLAQIARNPGKSIARKRNFVSAEVVFQRLHSSIT